MIGVYKITSPSGKIYIGQSQNIEKRFGRYRCMYVSKLQIRLNSSFKKYGVNKHRFEILEECTIDRLNEVERHYQELYDVLSENGLNCKLTSTKDKIVVHSKSTREKMSLKRKGRYVGKNNPNYGRHHTEESKELNRIAHLGKKMPEEQRLKRIGVLSGNAKKVICIKTGRIFQKTSEAAEYIGMKATTLGARLRGENFNNTTLRYYE